jgi:hypothetical protein
MATTQLAIDRALSASEWTLTKLAHFPRLRALAWDGDVLYASHGYTLLCARLGQTVGNIQWEQVGQFHSTWWRKLSSKSHLAARLWRDGFHALAVLPSGHLVGAVAGAIVTLAPGEDEFLASHLVLRGTRPLHITATPRQGIFWGEYFDNPQRDEVHIYASEDFGTHWEIAYTFPRGAIRHVHNIVYDRWENCLWVLTGDDGLECRILRASCDFRHVDLVLSGQQQTRSAALVPTEDALYFSADTPLELNYVYRMDRRGHLHRVTALNASSIYGCRVGNGVFFSTMVEPSKINHERNVCVYGGNEFNWRRMLQWQKDRWPMHWFQHGNAFLPDGDNTSGLLAVTTIAVENADLRTTIYRVGSQ